MINQGGGGLMAFIIFMQFYDTVAEILFSTVIDIGTENNLFGSNYLFFPFDFMVESIKSDASKWCNI